MKSAKNRSVPLLSSSSHLGTPTSLTTIALNYPWKPDLGPVFRVLALGEGQYLLADELNHRLLNFNSEGELLWQIGGKGFSAGEFWYPRGLALLDGEIFVCDSWNHRVQVIDLHGRFVRSFGRYGPESDQFNECSDIVAVGPQGRLWVIDTGNHCLKVLTPEGGFEGCVGRRFSIYEERAIYAEAESLSTLAADPGFVYPRRFLGSRDGWVLVDDSGNSRLALISEGGRLVATMDQRTFQVTNYDNLDTGSKVEMKSFPFPWSHAEVLKILDWDSTIWYEMPIPCLTEVDGRVLTREAGDQFLLHYYNWGTKELMIHRIDVSGGHASIHSWETD